MNVMVMGGLVRFVQGIAAAAPTLAVGLFIAAVLRYYLGQSGTKRLFGSESVWALPQAWLVGMLLPVCSIGVIPIIRELRRMGIRPGAITAFALSAPLFNPLSLLYGLTLSRPYVIVGFAFGSLLVVTILGLIWDRFAAPHSDSANRVGAPIGLRRLGVSAIFMGRELCGPSGVLALIALAGLWFLGSLLPHGALQSSVEQGDTLAPTIMSLVAVPIYATPMLTMSQLGMMFAHGNSPGAAFALLLLGTGVNLGTLWWIGQNFGWRSTAIWFGVLFAVVLGVAYAIDRPLIPPGVEPAGHTHAFDVYTNPFHSGTPLSLATIWDAIVKNLSIFDAATTGLVAVMLASGAASLTVARSFTDRMLEADFRKASENVEDSLESPSVGSGLNRQVSPRIVGLTCLAGLVALSIVGCYAYYPKPREVLEEMSLARVEVLTGITSREYDRALHWIPILEEWSRKLEVGYALRHFELRPYQQIQAYLLRKKLESLEHELEHEQETQELRSETGDSSHSEELDALRTLISENGRRLSVAFEEK
ncbi:permease [Aureliella helgolandensis]|uniref:Putative permease n=1 Tax=Aureliella helgolandensis TaxID=2527968 RepID=A0A518G3M2_9BACT|nr:permease [Aureliella helgolandensis]QDV23197.1 putative permease [Aureliella helgolandensis]